MGEDDKIPRASMTSTRRTMGGGASTRTTTELVAGRGGSEHEVSHGGGSRYPG